MRLREAVASWWRRTFAPKTFGLISITATDTTSHIAQTFTINVVPRL